MVKKINITVHFWLALTMIVFVSCRKEETVVTTGISEISATSAQCGGYVEMRKRTRVIYRGVCWNTTGSPMYYQSHTEDGYGHGEFSSNLTGLSPGTTYYVRAYAYTDKDDKETGDQVRYGQQEVFTTMDNSSFSYNGLKYTVSDFDNSSSIYWGNTGYLVGATSVSNGSLNTSYITANSSYGAGVLCANLVEKGYSDWFLPSKEELNAMYLNSNSIPNLSTAYYWSSTEYNTDLVWVQQLKAGTISQAFKNSYYPCRCVRIKK